MITHRLKRIAQTPRAFENWAPLLREMARPSAGAGTLTFRTRTGQAISCPNRPGARVPVYEVYAEDCYRLAATLGPLRDEPITVLDIGAHVGAFTCRLAQLAPKARIHCYEASETTAAYLRRNVADNDLADRVSVTAAAVAGEEGFVRFSDNGAGSALNGRAVADEGIPVPATTFDAIVAEVGSPELVKIDCEGGEYDLVFASSPHSWAAVQRVVLEFHPDPEHGWPQLRDWFAAAGMQVDAIVHAGEAQGTAWLSRPAG